jgi:hypothetical protein
MMSSVMSWKKGGLDETGNRRSTDLYRNSDQFLLFQLDHSLQSHRQRRPTQRHGPTTTRHAHHRRDGSRGLSAWLAIKLNLITSTFPSRS